MERSDGGSGDHELIAESTVEMLRFGSLTLLVSCDDVFGTVAWVSDDTLVAFT